jgi:hypothetical protein
MATAPASTKRDLKKVLLGVLKHKIPLVIGSAGSAGAKPHLRRQRWCAKLPMAKGWRFCDERERFI